MGIEECWNNNKTSKENAAEKTLCKKKTTRRKWWYDKKCQLAQENKNKDKVKMLQCPNDDNIERFKTLTVETRKLIIGKKRSLQHNPNKYRKTIK